MKKYIFFFIVVAFISCNSPSKYQINGTVDRSDLNGKYVFLYPYGPNITVPIDSALVKDNIFTFIGKQDIPQLCVLEFDVYAVAPQRPVAGQNNPYTATFVLENGNINVNLTNRPTVTGTQENDIWTALLQNIRTLQAEGVKFIPSIEEYILKYPDKLSAGKLFNDFYSVLDEEFRLNIIDKTNESFRSIPGTERLIEHLGILDNVRMGKKFVDLEMIDPDDNKRKLSEFTGQGKVVLLDFWASWCGPCLEAIPHFKKLYNEYHSNGFEIVGISLDRNKKEWINAIQTNQLVWPHLSDLNGWDNIGAQVYGINYVPNTILLDKDGLIIAKNIHGESLEKKLKEIFDK